MTSSSQEPKLPPELECYIFNLTATDCLRGPQSLRSVVKLLLVARRVLIWHVLPPLVSIVLRSTGFVQFSTTPSLSPTTLPIKSPQSQAKARLRRNTLQSR